MEKNTSFERCPKCRSIGSLRRSKSRTIREQIIKKTGFLNIFRCRKCGWRGVRSYLKLKRISFKTLLFYLILIALTAFIVRFLLLKFVL